MYVSHHKADALAKIIARVSKLEKDRLAFVRQPVLFIRGYVKSAAAKRRTGGPSESKHNKEQQSKT